MAKTFLGVVLGLVLMAGNAFGAASCVEHRSVNGFVSVFAITDPGGVADGNLLMTMVGTNYAIAQKSVTDYSTRVEDFGSWYHGDLTYVPNETNDPAIMALSECWDLGTVTYGSELLLANEHMTFLAYWFELTLFDTMKATVNYLTVVRSLNVNYTKAGIAAALVSWGVSTSVAESIAINYVDLGIKPKYNELGLTKVPVPVRTIVRTFSQVGYEWLQ